LHEKFSFDTLLLDEKTRYSTQDELNSWPTYMYGIDRQGHIVIYDSICQADLMLLDKTFGPPNDFNKLRMYRARFMRRVENVKKHLNDKFNVKLYKHSMVFDLNGFTMAHIKGERRKYVQRVISEMSEIYPECLHKVYAVNCPDGFKVAWAILRPFMDSVTAEKTKILTKDYLPELLNDIDIHMIPPKYGGKGSWEICLADCPKNFPVISL